MTPAPPITTATRSSATLRCIGTGRGRSTVRLLLLASLLTVAVLTLSPAGTGWAWGAPGQELQWYAGLSEDARTQLLGNLLLLVPTAVASVVLWPRLGEQPHLVRAALAAGATIEVLQWLLPLGRVVSPVDAVLNAVGAATAGWAVAQASTRRAPADCRVRQRHGPSRHSGRY